MVVKRHEFLFDSFAARDAQQHEDLDHDMETDLDELWDGTLSPKAQFLLKQVQHSVITYSSIGTQHALQHDIPTPQLGTSHCFTSSLSLLPSAALSRFHGYVQYHLHHTMQYPALIKAYKVCGNAYRLTATHHPWQDVFVHGPQALGSELLAQFFNVTQVLDVIVLFLT